jgi:hypothetical protein
MTANDVSVVVTRMILEAGRGLVSIRVKHPLGADFYLDVPITDWNIGTERALKYAKDQAQVLMSLLIDKLDDLQYEIGQK